MINPTAPSASPASSKCNVDIAPLLEIQDRLRQANIKLNASYVSNANKTSKKNEAVVQLLSTLILAFGPPAHGDMTDMSTLTPDYFIEKEDGQSLTTSAAALSIRR
jgi:hypothetical protein